MSYSVDNDWISATSTYHYMMKDPLIDWLKAHYHRQPSPRETSLPSFTSYIMEQGNVFEREIIKLLVKKFGNNRVISISSDLAARDLSKVEETKQAMKKGIPFIHSGVLHNTNNKTFGIPDLLVRSDWLKHLVKYNPISSNEVNIPSPKLGKNTWHYRVVDIKYTSLLLRADGVHLLNAKSFAAYKSQLLIYNWALGRVQGYTPTQTYILGRKWKYSAKGENLSGDSCFDRLGAINYKTVDKVIIKETRAALNWIREVRSSEAAKWNITTYPLHRWELYPNMSNSHDNQWRSVKGEIASDNNELTNLWMVGPKNRNHALECGIYQWTDEDCTPEALNINGEKTKNILQQIIDTNRDDSITITPDYIINNIGDWKHKPTIEFFVDFETCNGAMFKIKGLPKANTLNMIFMIGVGYIHPRSKEWKYKNFTAKNLTQYDEKVICRNFAKFIKDTSIKYNISNPRCVHWSHAEEVMWPDHTKVAWSWLDLLKVFKDEPITIKGCLNFGLKDVVNTMHSHGLINTCWDKNSKCTDGRGAMVAAIKAYEDSSDKSIMKDIIKYNEVDVTVLYEIITYLRRNHIKRKFRGSEPSSKRVALC